MKKSLVSPRTKSLSTKPFRPETLRYSTRLPASCPVMALTAPRVLITRSPVSRTYTSTGLPPSIIMPLCLANGDGGSTSPSRVDVASSEAVSAVGGLAHRDFAACRADAERSSALRLAALAAPPFLPPRRPISAAALFFLGTLGGVASSLMAAPCIYAHALSVCVGG